MNFHVLDRSPVGGIECRPVKGRFKFPIPVMLASRDGGKGGGRADLAQAGGTDTAHLPDALASVRDWVEQRF